MVETYEARQADIAPVESNEEPGHHSREAHGEDTPFVACTRPEQNEGLPREEGLRSWVDRQDVVVDEHPAENESVLASCWDGHTAHHEGSGATPGWDELGNHAKVSGAVEEHL